FLGPVELGDSGAYLAGFAANVHLQFQQLFRTWNRFGGQDGAGAQIDLGKVIDRDFFGARGSRLGTENRGLPMADGRWFAHGCWLTVILRSWRRRRICL